MKGYTTREVAEVLGLPTSRILSWARRGLIAPNRGPRGAYIFSFQDIVLLRTARELLDSDVPIRRVRASLEALRDQLPVGRPLSAVTISAVGDRVLVQDDETTWEPDSGQLQIAFPVADVANSVAPIARRRTEGALPSDSVDASGSLESTSADEWYDTAVDLEAVDVAQAIEAYRRALALEPGFSDAHLNLGRLLHEAGDVSGARDAYIAALRSDDTNARAHFNLGVALEDDGADVDAVEAYRHAVELEPHLAVAHFNLARLLEAGGHDAEAIRHLREYKRLATQPE